MSVETNQQIRDRPEHRPDLRAGLQEFLRTQLQRALEHLPVAVEAMIEKLQHGLHSVSGLTIA